MNNLQKAVTLLPGDAGAAVIFDTATRLWLTGFRSSAGALVISPSLCRLIIDSRYFEAAQKAAAGAFEVVLQDKRNEQIIAALKEAGVKSVAFLDDKITAREAAGLKETYAEFECIIKPELADSLRKAAMIKSAAEWAAGGFGARSVRVPHPAAAANPTTTAHSTAQRVFPVVCLRKLVPKPALMTTT